MVRAERRCRAGADVEAGGQESSRAAERVVELRWWASESEWAGAGRGLRTGYKCFASSGDALQRGPGIQSRLGGLALRPAK